MDYYLAIVKTKGAIHTPPPRMKLKCITLSKRSQSQKDTYSMIPFILLFSLKLRLFLEQFEFISR